MKLYYHLLRIVAAVLLVTVSTNASMAYSDVSSVVSFLKKPDTISGLKAMNSPAVKSELRRELGLLPDSQSPNLKPIQFRTLSVGQETPERSELRAKNEETFLKKSIQFLGWSGVAASALYSIFQNPIQFIDLLLKGSPMVAEAFGLIGVTAATIYLSKKYAWSYVVKVAYLFTGAVFVSAGFRLVLGDFHSIFGNADDLLKTIAIYFSAEFLGVFVSKLIFGNGQGKSFREKAISAFYWVMPYSVVSGYYFYLIQVPFLENKLFDTASRVTFDLGWLEWVTIIPLEVFLVVLIGEGKKTDFNLRESIRKAFNLYPISFLYLFPTMWILWSVSEDKESLVFKSILAAINFFWLGILYGYVNQVFYKTVSRPGKSFKMRATALNLTDKTISIIRGSKRFWNGRQIIAAMAEQDLDNAWKLSDEQFKVAIDKIHDAFSRFDFRGRDFYSWRPLKGAEEFVEAILAKAPRDFDVTIAPVFKGLPFGGRKVLYYRLKIDANPDLNLREKLKDISIIQNEIQKQEILDLVKEIIANARSANREDVDFERIFWFAFQIVARDAQSFDELKNHTLFLSTLISHPSFVAQLQNQTKHLSLNRITRKNLNNAGSDSDRLTGDFGSQLGFLINENQNILLQIPWTQLIRSIELLPVAHNGERSFQVVFDGDSKSWSIQPITASDQTPNTASAVSSRSELRGRPTSVSTNEFEIVKIFQNAENTDKKSTFNGDGDEQVVLVNRKTRRRVGVKEKKFIHRDQDWHSRVLGIVLDPKGQILLQKRRKGKSRSESGKFDFSVSAHHGPDETVRETFSRETKEELGFRPDSGNLYQLSRDHSIEFSMRHSDGSQDNMIITIFGYLANHDNISGLKSGEFKGEERNPVEFIAAFSLPYLLKELLKDKNHQIFSPRLHFFFSKKPKYFNRFLRLANIKLTTEDRENWRKLRNRSELRSFENVSGVNLDSSARESSPKVRAELRDLDFPHRLQKAIEDIDVISAVWGKRTLSKVDLEEKTRLISALVNLDPHRFGNHPFRTAPYLDGAIDNLEQVLKAPTLDKAEKKVLDSALHTLRELKQKERELIFELAKKLKSELSTKPTEELLKMWKDFIGNEGFSKRLWRLTALQKDVRRRLGGNLHRLFLEAEIAYMLVKQRMGDLTPFDTDNSVRNWGVELRALGKPLKISDTSLFKDSNIGDVMFNAWLDGYTTVEVGSFSLDSQGDALAFDVLEDQFKFLPFKVRQRNPITTFLKMSFLVIFSFVAELLILRLLNSLMRYVSLLPIFSSLILYLAQIIFVLIPGLIVYYYIGESTEPIKDDLKNVLEVQDSVSISNLLFSPHILPFLQPIDSVKPRAELRNSPRREFERLLNSYSEPQRSKISDRLKDLEETILMKVPVFTLNLNLEKKIADEIGLLFAQNANSYDELIELLDLATRLVGYEDFPFNPKWREIPWLELARQLKKYGDDVQLTRIFFVKAGLGQKQVLEFVGPKKNPREFYLHALKHSIDPMLLRQSIAGLAQLSQDKQADFETVVQILSERVTRPFNQVKLKDLSWTDFFVAILFPVLGLIIYSWQVYIGVFSIALPALIVNFIIIAFSALYMFHPEWRKTNQVVTYFLKVRWNDLVGDRLRSYAVRAFELDKKPGEVQKPLFENYWLDEKDKALDDYLKIKMELYRWLALEGVIGALIVSFLMTNFPLIPLIGSFLTGIFSGALDRADLFFGGVMTLLPVAGLYFLGSNLIPFWFKLNRASSLIDRLEKEQQRSELRSNPENALLPDLGLEVSEYDQRQLSEFLLVYEFDDGINVISKTKHRRITKKQIRNFRRHVVRTTTGTGGLVFMTEGLFRISEYPQGTPVDIVFEDGVATAALVRDFSNWNKIIKIIYFHLIREDSGIVPSGSFYETISRRRYKPFQGKNIVIEGNLPYKKRITILKQEIVLGRPLLEKTGFQIRFNEHGRVVSYERVVYQNEFLDAYIKVLSEAGASIQLSLDERFENDTDLEEPKRAKRKAFFQIFTVQEDGSLSFQKTTGQISAVLLKQLDHHVIKTVTRDDGSVGLENKQTFRVRQYPNTPVEILIREGVAHAVLVYDSKNPSELIDVIRFKRIKSLSTDHQTHFYKTIGSEIDREFERANLIVEGFSSSRGFKVFGRELSLGFPNDDQFGFEVELDVNRNVIRFHRFRREDQFLYSQIKRIIEDGKAKKTPNEFLELIAFIQSKVPDYPDLPSFLKSSSNAMQVAGRSIEDVLQEIETHEAVVSEQVDLVLRELDKGTINPKLFQLIFRETPDVFTKLKDKINQIIKKLPKTNHSLEMAGKLLRLADLLLTILITERKEGKLNDKDVTTWSDYLINSVHVDIISYIEQDQRGNDTSYQAALSTHYKKADLYGRRLMAFRYDQDDIDEQIAVNEIDEVKQMQDGGAAPKEFSRRSPVAPSEEMQEKLKTAALRVSADEDRGPSARQKALDAYHQLVRGLAPNFGVRALISIDLDNLSPGMWLYYKDLGGKDDFLIVRSIDDSNRRVTGKIAFQTMAGFGRLIDELPREWIKTSRVHFLTDLKRSELRVVERSEPTKTFIPITLSSAWRNLRAAAAETFIENPDARSELRRSIFRNGLEVDNQVRFGLTIDSAEIDNGMIGFLLELSSYMPVAVIYRDLRERNFIESKINAGISENKKLIPASSPKAAREALEKRRVNFAVFASSIKEKSQLHEVRLYYQSFLWITPEWGRSRFANAMDAIEMFAASYQHFMSSV